MKRHLCILLLLLLILIPLTASALETLSGGEVRIDQAVEDDVFASGGSITVNAPIDSLIAAGGQITVNAPVAGDVIAAGGQVTLNSDVGGKVVAAGGTVTLNGKVGTNAVLTGGEVTLGRESSVARDAMISGGNVVNAGDVAGTLSVKANTFTNEGSAGSLDVELQQRGMRAGTFLSLFGILFTVGLFLLGLVLIRIAPHRFDAVVGELSTSPLLAVVGGFLAILVGFLLVIILAITMVLLPFALLLGFIGGTWLLLSTLFTSSALGRWIGTLIKKDLSPYVAFLVGFVILNLLFRIPVAGFFLLVIAASIGFGAILLTVRRYRKAMCGTPAA
ncbi:MAG: hypothetical protein LUO86_04510 [Methanomicrobiales archaeon]|nr:hypothetical protein [Methanomicrobiales archaeon]